MSTAARTALMRPALGVIPPSLRALHNSMRSAPPLAAATADSRESTQISSSMTIASHVTRKRPDSFIGTHAPRKESGDKKAGKSSAATTAGAAADADVRLKNSAQ